MATYKSEDFLDKDESDEFDKLHLPGTVISFTGIYRCEGCGRELICGRGQALPLTNHHQHEDERLAVQWRLIVFADHNPKYLGTISEVG